jgi:thioredoxin 1
MASPRTVKRIPLARMDCPTCIPLLEREVSALDGVEAVQGNYLNKTVTVTYDPARVPLDAIEAAIERIGYRIAYKKYPSVLSRLRGLLTAERMEKVATLTDADFTAKVLDASRPVAVLFSSPTCPPCRVFKQRFSEVAEKVQSKADFYEMDITVTETWRTHEVLSIPTVLVFRGGKLSERFDGLPRGEDIARALGVDR